MEIMVKRECPYWACKSGTIYSEKANANGIRDESKCETCGGSGTVEKWEEAKDVFREVMGLSDDRMGWGR